MKIRYGIANVKMRRLKTPTNFEAEFWNVKIERKMKYHYIHNDIWNMDQSHWGTTYDKFNEFTTNPWQILWPLNGLNVLHIKYVHCFSISWNDVWILQKITLYHFHSYSHLYFTGTICLFSTLNCLNLFNGLCFLACFYLQIILKECVINCIYN